MTIDMNSLIRAQIAALSQVLTEREIDFEIPSTEVLEKATRRELELIKRALHEVVYAPPSRR